MPASIGERFGCEWLGFEALSPPLLYELFRFRQAIFVVEQRCAYPDLDGLDQRAKHLLARIDGDMVGCLRLIPHLDDARVAIGRVAVGKAWRRRGLARLMMTTALARCRHDYAGFAVTLSAQTYLALFYESLGFQTTSAPYDDYGVAHVEMALRPPCD